MKIRLNPFGILARMRNNYESNENKSFFQKIKDGASYFTTNFGMRSKWKLMDAILGGRSFDSVIAEVSWQIVTRLTRLITSESKSENRNTVTEIRAGILDYLFLGIPLMLRAGFHLLREKYNQVANVPDSEAPRFQGAKKFFLGMALTVVGLISYPVEVVFAWVELAIKLAVALLVIAPMQFIGVMSHKITSEEAVQDVPQVSGMLRSLQSRSFMRKVDEDLHVVTGGYGNVFASLAMAKSVLDIEEPATLTLGVRNQG